MIKKTFGGPFGGLRFLKKSQISYSSRFLFLSIADALERFSSKNNIFFANTLESADLQVDATATHSTGKRLLSPGFRLAIVLEKVDILAKSY